LRGGGGGMEIEYAKLPLLPHVEQWAADGAICGGTKRNLDFYSNSVEWGGTSESQRIVLCDSQTSGGLLVALPRDEAQDLTTRINSVLGSARVPTWAAVIGSIDTDHLGHIRLS
jgi:selenophosphate synthase